MVFKKIRQPGSIPASPEALYRDLPRKPDAVPGLWAHQADLLRSYTSDHVNTSDLALELPTGTGKTLVGLLVADWVRQKKAVRVAYACPTQQLARQVATTAAREGVTAALLIGSYLNWPTRDQLRYESAAATAITTYSTIFNSSPKLVPAGLVVFDDAHAGEQYVAEQYSVEVLRRKSPTDYEALLTVLAPALDNVFIQRLRDETPDPGIRGLVRLVIPIRQPNILSAVDGILSGLPAPYSFRYSMIRSGLAACLVYVGYSSILVRPMTPPTVDNKFFIETHQRLYLSATLGDGGELERAFGRSQIVRLALPVASPTPRSGRRFFVFPELVVGKNADTLCEAIVSLAGKALVLAPDTDTAVERAHTLAQPGWDVMTIDDVEDGMEPFARQTKAICALANRYDGLDLPGDACRVVVLEGSPDQDSLQERFLSDRVRANAALAERVRTRIIQGTGRCTRGPNDWAVVVVLGASLTGILMRPELQNALSPELQAELKFGIENCQDTDASSVLEMVRIFLAQADAWRDEAEPLLAEHRRESIRVTPAGTMVLADSVKDEIEACANAARGRWAEAHASAQEAARRLGTGGEATRGYAALWLYLASVWMDHAADLLNDPSGRVSARTLLRHAELTAPGTWIREMAPLPNMTHDPLPPADAAAVARVLARALQPISQNKHDNLVTNMHHGLSQTDPSQYEPAVTILGQLLGAAASKPPGKGRCDSTWCWENDLWIAVDAKSDHEPTGLIPHKDIRQANDQLRLLCSDRFQDVPPVGSATVIISPKPAVDPDGVTSAEPHVHFVSLNDISNLALDAEAAWKYLRANRPGRGSDALRELVTDTFSQHGLLPTQILDRLTRQPVGSIV